MSDETVYLSVPQPTSDTELNIMFSLQYVMEQALIHKGIEPLTEQRIASWFNHKYGSHE